MPLPLRLDFVIDRLLLAEASGRRVLEQAAGVRFSVGEAALLWPQVLEHKWLLSERLGRNVGERVAALDFFENLLPLHRDSEVRPPRRRGRSPRLAT